MNFIYLSHFLLNLADGRRRTSNKLDYVEFAPTRVGTSKNGEDATAVSGYNHFGMKFDQKGFVIVVCRLYRATLPLVGYLFNCIFAFSKTCTCQISLHSSTFIFVYI
jgi:hypothetical protein